MKHARSELRMVFLKDTKTGYFHTWTKKAVQVDDELVIAETKAIVELEDGSVAVFDPTEIVFDPRDQETRRSEEARERVRAEVEKGWSLG